MAKSKNGNGKSAPVGALGKLRERHAKEERALIMGACKQAKWLIPHASRELGVATSTLQYIVEKDEVLREARELARPWDIRMPGRPEP